MFIRSKNSLLDPVGHLVSTNTVIGPFPSYLHTFYFSYLLGIAKTLSTILSKRGYSVSFLILEEIVLRFFSYSS